MKCPHCLHAYHSDPQVIFHQKDRDGWWRVAHETCPECKRLILTLHKVDVAPANHSYVTATLSVEYFRPRAIMRPLPDPAVVGPYREDYIEACAVISLSPKASAALTRRCLQAILKDKGGFTQRDLADQIDAALSGKSLPSHITESLDAVRNIGNFAAHPQKSKASGELIDVEPGEAEWNLEAIDALFDFYFVQPSIIKSKRAALDAKLSAAGKPPLKK